ncbi:MAG: MBL fold metallo-hydrolase [Calditrichaceae bacterium]
MRITIVFDNTSLSEECQAEWGFACYIETEHRRILFDTGADGKILLDNMRALSIDPKSVDDVFISHNHFDHIGGLAAFLNENSAVRIFLPKSFRGVRKAREIIYIDEARQIDEGLFTTGELDGLEQSLVIQTSKGLVVVVGCAHPDMQKILTSASQFGNIYWLIGGLHGFNKFHLLKDLKLICPTHCTQYNTEIKNLFPLPHTEGGVGRTINIP